MKVVYIAGPYRANTPRGIVENIRKAETAAIKYWRAGYAVICPHMNTALMDGLLPDEAWLKGGIEILGRCDVVVMLKGWEWSHGAIEEHKRALELGLQVEYD